MAEGEAAAPYTRGGRTVDPGYSFRPGRFAVFQGKMSTWPQFFAVSRQIIANKRDSAVTGPQLFFILAANIAAGRTPHCGVTPKSDCDAYQIRSFP